MQVLLDESNNVSHVLSRRSETPHVSIECMGNSIDDSNAPCAAVSRKQDDLRREGGPIGRCYFGKLQCCLLIEQPEATADTQR